MSVNLLNALMNIAKYKRNDIRNIYIGHNRVNQMGDALEYYVRDAYCNSFDIEDLNEKLTIHHNFFSYIGNSSNPPDFIVKSGEAVEVKKSETMAPSLQLNSSFPKNKLYFDDSKITESCKSADGGTWIEKPMIYSMGYVKNNSLKELFFVDGECYAAEKEIYENVLSRAKEGIELVFDPSERYVTKEIGRIIKTDALESAYLRVRPMWILKHPRTVFEGYLHLNRDDRLSIVAILPKFRYLSYDNYNEFEKTVQFDKNFSLEFITIPNPNNPKRDMEVVIIHLIFKNN